MVCKDHIREFNVARNSGTFWQHIGEEVMKESDFSANSSFLTQVNI